MKDEIREHILAILNSCWHNTVGVPDIEISGQEMKEVESFIKSNRIEGYLYRALQKGNGNAVILRCCGALYKENLRAYSKIMESIKYVAKCLKNHNDEYALVNGSYYIPFVCKPGDRIQKDIDILVDRQKYDQIHKELIAHGFIQSIIEGETIREAGRIEKIVAFKNNKHVIPYYKNCLNDNIGDVWIDVDISELDEEDFKKFLEKRLLPDDSEITCLDLETNIVYACKTIYTKLKTFRYIKQKQDNVLFYFCELNQMIRDYFDCVSWEKVEQRVKKMKLEKAVYYTVSVLIELFGTSYIKPQRDALCNLTDRLNVQDIFLVNRIYDEKEHKEYVYDCSEKEYLFSMHHGQLLREDKKDQKGKED